MSNFLVNAVKEKCPFCGKGDVFKETGFLKVPEMHAECPVCHRDFTGEPGYYFGAMYVSYAIAVFVGVSTYVLCTFVLGIENLYALIGIISGMILLISYKNFKWSRIIWLKIFPPGENTNFYKEVKKDAQGE